MRTLSRKLRPELEQNELWAKPASKRLMRKATKQPPDSTKLRESTEEAGLTVFTFFLPNEL